MVFPPKLARLVLAEFLQTLLNLSAPHFKDNRLSRWLK